METASYANPPNHSLQIGQVQHCQVLRIFNAWQVRYIRTQHAHLSSSQPLRNYLTSTRNMLSPGAAIGVLYVTGGSSVSRPSTYSTSPKGRSIPTTQPYASRSLSTCDRTSPRQWTVLSKPMERFRPFSHTKKSATISDGRTGSTAQRYRPAVFKTYMTTKTRAQASRLRICNCSQERMRFALRISRKHGWMGRRVDG